MRLRQRTILLLLASATSAALPLLGALSNGFPGRSHDLCFTAGSVTYQLAPSAAAPDYRVRIDNAALHPDLRVRLVDRAELADFVWVDDAGAAPDSGCATAGAMRSVGIVPAGKASDVTIAVSEDASEADFALFVHSARATHQDAAALFALMRHVESHPKVAAAPRQETR
jgi:hypothetical protein